MPTNPKINTEQDFKRLPRLRYRRNPEDMAIEAYGARKALRNDHLTFWGPGELAIYYKRDTRRAAGAARKWWIQKLPLQRGVSPLIFEVRGDCDGLIIFGAKDENDVPNPFCTSLARIAAGKRLAQRLG